MKSQNILAKAASKLKEAGTEALNTLSVPCTQQVLTGLSSESSEPLHSSPPSPSTLQVHAPVWPIFCSYEIKVVMSYFLAQVQHVSSRQAMRAMILNLPDAVTF